TLLGPRRTDGFGRNKHAAMRVRGVELATQAGGAFAPERAVPIGAPDFPHPDLDADEGGTLRLRRGGPGDPTTSSARPRTAQTQAAAGKTPQTMARRRSIPGNVGSISESSPQRFQN